MGITAVGATAIASLQRSPTAWLITWGCEALVAVAMAVWTAPVRRRVTPGRRFFPDRVGDLSTASLRRFCWRSPDVGARARWLDRLHCRCMAPPSRRGVGHGRRAFHTHRSPDGSVLHGFRRRGLFSPSSWSNAFLAAGFGGFT